MPKVYSYLRFSDPKQAAGSSADRQADYAQRWASEHGLALDEALSLRDEGLSGYHQRHVTHGALGLFLRAIEDGMVDAGSVLVVEALDRLSRAEPIDALSQLTQIINAGVTVVTAVDGQEYSRAEIKANPFKLFGALVVMARAHEESDTKSKRVRAAIRRQCAGWQAGTWRGVIRVGKDPHWVRHIGKAWELVPDRAAALRFAVDRFLDGLGGVQVMRELAARGMATTESGSLGAAHLYKTLRKRLLLGEREIAVGGETYHLQGYYPALLTPDEFDRLQLALDRRKGKRGVGEIPSILTGMGIAVCGYCGAAMASQNQMGRPRMPDGRPWPGHRRLMCTRHSKGHGCSVQGSIHAAPIERALMRYCADQLRMDALLSGGDAGNSLRAGLAAARRRLAALDTKLDKLGRVLLDDDGPAPITVMRQIRAMEAEADAARAEIATAERELAGWKPAASPEFASQWLDLMEGVELLEPEPRLRARELVRASFQRIVVWHRGEPAGVADGKVAEIEITARGGGQVWLRVDRETGRMVDG
jgi:DNA invertase Pin-like site-specific DNA recombinase